VKLLTVDTIDQVREKILEKAKSWPLKIETVSLDKASGYDGNVSSGEAQNRILAEDIHASCDIPSFRRAIVDGYAVIAADIAGASEAVPVFLKQTGSVSMGEPAGFSLQNGETAYVPTGGMLPNGADAVVMTEYCENSYGNVAVYEAVAPGTGMAETGEDIRKGEPLVRKGAMLRPQEAGLLAAAGVTNVPVFSPLKLFIISSGDELVLPEQNPAPGQIRDINTRLLKALALKRSFQVVSSLLLPDDEARLEAAVREALNSSDIVIVSGGSSQGEKDLSARVINQAAKPGVFSHGLALKPGKPTITGWDDKSQTLLAGLPGHPVAAMMVFELLLGWLHDALFNLRAPLPIPASVSCNVPGSPGRTVCQPVILRLEADSYYAEPVFGKSGMITTMTRADGYIIIDRNKEGLKKNEPVLVHLF
jgi:molybdopterin molybdotransferase